ncbi:MAG: EAL domain-containing protein [Deltaproteobacteria bacterium]|nr:EAL domain-containing protein [Deltaproteobacteria bacterium]
MESALNAADLGVVFQPIVNLQNGSLFAVEALVRCEIPRFQWPPVLFEHAVAHHYCGRLGRAIRDVTFKLCGGVPVFVNIHPAELSQRWLVRPDDPIFSHDNDVYLEITESVPFSHYSLCVSVLSEIRRRGQLKLVIDDLGSGFSNLKRISDLQPQVVKLDMELVAGIDRNATQRRLVASIVRLCIDMGAWVVAEGIENEDELSAVIDTGAHFGQGYLLARPAYPIPEIQWPI